MGGAVMRARRVSRQNAETENHGRGHLAAGSYSGATNTVVASGERIGFDPAQHDVRISARWCASTATGTIPKRARPNSKCRRDIWSRMRNMLRGGPWPPAAVWVAESETGDELNLSERCTIVSDGDNYDKSAESPTTARDLVQGAVISPSGAFSYDHSLPLAGQPGGRWSFIESPDSPHAGWRQGEFTLRNGCGVKNGDVIQARDGALLVIADDKNHNVLQVTPACSGSK